MIEIEVPSLDEWRVIVDGVVWTFETHMDSVKFIQYINGTLKGRRDMTDEDIRRFVSKILQMERKRKLERIGYER